MNRNSPAGAAGGWIVVLGWLPLAAIAQVSQNALPYDPNAPPVNQPPVVLSPPPPPVLPSGVAVGRTQGSMGVSPSGDANYSIPLWTPPGIAGLGASLALSYSSAAGDGWYGVGWNLAGLSTITRCAKTYGQDGLGANVILTNADRFCLDGKKLRSSGTYGGDGTQYQTEVADFSLVISHGTAGTGPAWFEVHGKSGLIYQYGNTVNSALVATGTTTVLTWGLNRISDRFGNHMDFDYDHTVATTYQVLQPTTIQYTTPGTTGGVQTTPNYQVSFTYVSRTGTVPNGFIAGAQFMEPFLAQTITVSDWTGSAYTSVRTYNLTYVLSTTTGRSELQTLQECSPTQCFPATAVGYQSGTAGWSADVATPGASGGLWTSLVVDLNGDGVEDIVYKDHANPNNWYYLLGQRSGTYLGPYAVTPAPLSGKIVVPIDFNSDGKMDLMTVNSSGNWRILYFQSAGAAFTYTDTTVPAPMGSLNGYVLTGDVDGDGRDDVIYAVSSGQGLWTTPDHIYYRLNTGTTFGAEQTLATIGSTTCTVCQKLTLNPFGSYSPYNTRIRRPDVNGDGRVDFFVNIERCTIANGCGSPTFSWNLYVSDATAVQYDNLGVVSYGATGLASNLVAPLFGDFNGDGCTDVATAEGGWTVRYGTCLRSGAANALSAPVNSGVPAHGIYAMALDWDGDGMDDIVEPDTAAGHFGYIRSTGTTFSAWTSTGLAYNNADTIDNAVVVVDTNGDGLYELAYPVGAGYTINVLPHKGATVISDVANSITDGFGVNFSPSYSQLTDPTVYVPISGASYPQQDIQTSRNVVSSYTASDGIGGTYTIGQAYYYERQNLPRRESEGFAKVRTHDSRNGFYRFQQFGQLFPYTGIVSEDSLYQSNVTTFISDVTNTLASATLDSTTNNQRYFPYVSQTVNKRYELNGPLDGTLITQATTVYTFGGANTFTYGNPSKIVTTTIDEDSTSPWNGNTFTDTVNITPYEVGGTGATGWCIHLPSQVSETRLLPGGSTLTHTTALSVNTHSECEVDSKTVEPSSTVDKVLTALLYDGCGNVNSSSVTGQTAAGAAMTPRTTTANYGTHCLQPETITNALSQPTVLGYRYDLELLTSSKDPNLLTTSWTYNDVGQKTLESRPDGSQTVYTPNACTSPNYCLSDSNTRYYIHRAEQDTSAFHMTYWVTDTYFDQFDRLKYDNPQQSNGVQVSRFTNYDNRGRVVATTNPSGNGFGSYTTSTVYDDLNRPTSVSRPRSATDPTLLYTRFTYQGRTKTIKDPKLYTTTQQSDVIGELLRVTDPDGVSVTNYAFNPFGALISTSDPASNATTTTFDTLGYLPTGSSDPDRGTWVSQFDSLGELANLRDAKTTAPSWTQQLTYDALGRPLTRVESEGTTTWTWGTVAANHEIGQLKQLTGLSDTEDYTFDAYGRPATHKQTWSGTAYTVSYAFNVLGKLDTLTYPATPLSANPFAVKYGYSNGYLSSLQDYTGGTAGTTFWQLTPSTVNMDPWGHVADETLGTTTAVRIQSAFDAVTGWIGTRQVGSGGNSSNLQNLAYSWDDNGNLSQRQDLKQTLTEVFSYDNLNRIQNSTLNGTQNFFAVIDATGNISSRTEAGITYPYTYNSTHKHAVATVGSVSYGYDANGNMSTRNGFTVGWSSANQPISLSATGVSAAFSYGPDRQRKQQTAVYNNEGTNGTENTIYVAGLMEIETTPAQTHYKHWITVPGGTQIVYDLQSVSGAQTTYITADHLGSGNLLLNSGGTTLINESYAAYGYRRKSDWSAPLGAASPAYTTIASTTRRGYTDAFHEMIDNLGLIHMNGRMYDPVIGRFLSPDPLGGRAGASQSLNPYSYVSNKPLTDTDPSGNWYHTPYVDACPGCSSSFGTTPNLIIGLEEIVIPGYRSVDNWTGTVPVAIDSPQGSPGSGSGNGDAGTSLENVVITAHKKKASPDPPCTKYSKQAAFVNANLPEANQIASQLDTSAGNILGLAGLESGWGGGQLIAAGTNNYFSLKAGPAFATGAIGSYQYGPNTFWSYPGPGMLASGDAFAQSYFGKRVFGTTNPQDFAAALNAGGKYNKGAGYNETLLSTINQANAVMGCP